VFFLLLLPGKLMDTVVQDIIGALTGGVLFAYYSLENLSPHAGLGTVLGILGLVLIYIGYQVSIHEA
jgi:hypothetical protein